MTTKPVMFYMNETTHIKLDFDPADSIKVSFIQWLCIKYTMTKYWKEEYSLERAEACGIRTHEGSVMNRWGESRWIYHVEILDFTFSFFSIEMLDKYIEFFSLAILNSTRFSDSSPFSNGPAASIGDGQSPFERLPSYLRKKNKRPKVLKALLQARDEFVKNA